MITHINLLYRSKIKINNHNLIATNMMIISKLGFNNKMKNQNV